jgi:voltage-gated potassium channel Kch
MELLKRARIRRARCLISFIDDDDVNVELSLRIQEVAGQTRLENQDYDTTKLLKSDHQTKGERI